MNIMDPKKVVLIGYSGHALVIAEALLLTGCEILGYLEKQEVSKNELNIKYLGYELDPEVIKRIAGHSLIAAIGNNQIRREVMAYFGNYTNSFITVIHPDSKLSTQVRIGSGTYIGKGVCINPFVEIGRGAIINTGSIIEHECLINDFVHVAPGAVLAGRVIVGENTLIGANAVVKQGVTIGANVVVGAGAVVIENIDDNLMVVGNPARVINK